MTVLVAKGKAPVGPSSPSPVRRSTTSPEPLECKGLAPVVPVDLESHKPRGIVFQIKADAIQLNDVFISVTSCQIIFDLSADPLASVRKELVGVKAPLCCCAAPPAG